MLERTGLNKQNRYSTFGSGEIQFGYHSIIRQKKRCGEEVLGNCLHLWSGVDIRSRARVSISMHRKWKSKIRNWRFMDERILLVELVTYGREVVVIDAYAPTDDTAGVGKDKFWDTLRDILEEILRSK
jgi:hypothetical protein